MLCGGALSRALSRALFVVLMLRERARLLEKSSRASFREDNDQHLFLYFFFSSFLPSFGMRSSVFLACCFFVVTGNAR